MTTNKPTTKPRCRLPWKRKEQRVVVGCRRCHGTGFVPRFAHYHGGLCFDCKGSGQRTMTGQQIVYHGVDAPVILSESLVRVQS